MHWRDGEAGRGALFAGDIVMVAMDRRWATFMYSIPERPRLVRRAMEILQPYEFERIYPAFWDRVVGADASAAVRRSAER